MHNKKKNTNKSNNFIQGLRPLSSSLPHGLKKILRKGGYNFSNIVDNWTKMVGKNISEYCYPDTVKMNKNMNNGVLILNVVHGKELDIEYEKKEIIDQINSFFGYDCVSKISLKIIQEKLKKEKKDLPTIKNFSQIKDKIEKIDNNQLRSSLNNFLKLYNAKKK